MCIVVVLAREKEEDLSKGDGTIPVTDIGVGWVGGMSYRRRIWDANKGRRAKELLGGEGD